MNEMKDFSLLRPFDLEAAKSGAAFIFNDGSPRTFIAGPNRCGHIVIADESGDFQISRTPGSTYYMAPLAWVKVSDTDPTLRPVYKGDTVYYSKNVSILSGQSRIIFAYTENSIFDGRPRFSLEGGAWASIEDLVCTPPKVKREGWVVALKHSVKQTEEQAETIRNSLYEPDMWFVSPVEWEEQP